MQYSRPQPTAVYVLKLEHGKFYIGCSDQAAAEIRRHTYSSTHLWTQLYHPIETLLVIPGTVADEAALVQMWIRDNGIENVRGGKYQTVILPRWQITGATPPSCGLSEKHAAMIEKLSESAFVGSHTATTPPARVYMEIPPKQNFTKDIEELVVTAGDAFRFLTFWTARDE